MAETMQNKSNNNKEMIAQKKGRKALVVDDSPLGRKVLESMLKEFSVEVVTACNGLEAVERFDESMEFVFIDFNMPKMNGDEATKAIREKEKKFKNSKSVYILGFSANDINEINGICLEVGMNQVVQRPIMMELLEKVFENDLKR